MKAAQKKNSKKNSRDHLAFPADVKSNYISYFQMKMKILPVNDQ